MKTDEQREALKGVYPGPDWQEKVKAMSDGQVSAIYLRLKSQKKV